MHASCQAGQFQRSFSSQAIAQSHGRALSWHTLIVRLTSFSGISACRTWQNYMEIIVLNSVFTHRCAKKLPQHGQKKGGGLVKAAVRHGKGAWGRWVGQGSRAGRPGCRAQRSALPGWRACADRQEAGATDDSGNGRNRRAPAGGEPACRRIAPGRIRLRACSALSGRAFRAGTPGN